MRYFSFTLLARGLGAMLLVSCAATPPPVPDNDLMSQTEVGAQRCASTKPQKRPFVVEWDATDLATFEAAAQRDVVLVRYEGCELEILDGCNDPQISGKYGVYLPPRWTSGSLETFDINNEAELYTKLPLGASKFGGAIQSGQSLHLSYYVSGTTTMDRGAVYSGELNNNPNCAGATHVVHSFNSGAFELSASANASAGGQLGTSEIGAGGSTASTHSRLKQAGDTNSCKSKKAVDLSSCRVPIRLSLRALMPGTPPAAIAEDRPATVTAPDGAPHRPAPLASDDDVIELRQSARMRTKMGDGGGCLSALDQAKKRDPAGDSQRDIPMVRATCEMQTGLCEEGKQRYRLYLENAPSSRRLSNEEIDSSASQLAATYCTESSRAPEDLARSVSPRIRDAKRHRDTAQCEQLTQTLIDIFDALPQRTESDDIARQMAIADMHWGIDCLVRAGMCQRAKELWIAQQYHTQKTASRRDNFEQHLEKGFDRFSECRSR